MVNYKNYPHLTRRGFALMKMSDASFSLNEKILRVALYRVMEPQRKRVLSALRFKVGKLAKASDPSDGMFSFKVEDSAVNEGLTVAYRQVYASGLKDGAVMLGEGFRQDPIIPRAYYAVAHSAEKLGHQLNLETKKRLANEIADGMRAGETFEQMAERVNVVYDSVSYKGRAYVTARTEAAAGYNAGMLESMRQNLISYKEWVCLYSETQIETEKGKKRIRDIKGGEKVLGVFEGKIGWYEVKASVKNSPKEGWVKVSWSEYAGREGNRWLLCTREHLFLTPGGWVPACSLKLSDSLISPYRKMNEDQSSYVLGTLLGDGYVSLRKPHGANLVITHSVRQKSYFEWKLELIREWASGKVREYGVGSTRHYTTTFLKTCRDVWRIVHLYGENRAVTREVMKEMNFKALAVWFMDDGCYNEGKAKKYSDSVKIAGMWSGEEKQVIAEWFKSKEISIYWSRHKADRGEYLCVKVESQRRFFELIAEFVHESMRYKLPCRLRGLASYKWNSVGEWAISEFEIGSVVEVPGKRSRYDLTVEHAANFTARGVFVHNSTSPIPRPDHAAANGQIVATNEDFRVGGFPAAHPGDWRLPPELRLNCRCVLSPITDYSRPSESITDPDLRNEVTGFLDKVAKEGGTKLLEGEDLRQATEQFTDLYGVGTAEEAIRDGKLELGINMPALDVSRMMRSGWYRAGGGGHAVLIERELGFPGKMVGKNIYMGIMPKGSQIVSYGDARVTVDWESVKRKLVLSVGDTVNYTAYPKTMLPNLGTYQSLDKVVKSSPLVELYATVPSNYYSGFVEAILPTGRLNVDDLRTVSFVELVNRVKKASPVNKLAVQELLGEAMKSKPALLARGFVETSEGYFQRGPKFYERVSRVRAARPRVFYGDLTPYGTAASSGLYDFPTYMKARVKTVQGRGLMVDGRLTDVNRLSDEQKAEVISTLNNKLPQPVKRFIESAGITDMKIGHTFSPFVTEVYDRKDSMLVLNLGDLKDPVEGFDVTVHGFLHHVAERNILSSQKLALMEAMSTKSVPYFAHALYGGVPYVEEEIALMLTMYNKSSSLWVAGLRKLGAVGYMADGSKSILTTEVLLSKISVLKGVFKWL